MIVISDKASYLMEQMRQLVTLSAMGGETPFQSAARAMRYLQLVSSEPLPADLQAEGWVVWMDYANHVRKSLGFSQVERGMA